MNLSPDLSRRVPDLSHTENFNRAVLRKDSRSETSRREPSCSVLGAFPHPALPLLFRLLPAVTGAVGLVVGPAAESVIEVANVLLTEKSFEDIVVTLPLATVLFDFPFHRLAHSDLFVRDAHSTLTSALTLLRLLVQ